MIEENLRRVYQETLDEDVPERFRVLLDRLRGEGRQPVDSSLAADGARDRTDE